MNDQHNTNNNQNTYRNNERSDSFGSNAHFGEPNTRVLSDDERRDFDGVTIEEVGDSVHVDSTPSNMNEEYQRGEEYNQYGPHVKVYSFNSTSWLSRIILIIILAIVLAAVVFFRWHYPLCSRGCHFSGALLFPLSLGSFNDIIYIL